MMRVNKLNFVALLAILCFWSIPTLGQSSQGSITGTVMDPQGAVVVGAKVTATDTTTGESREAVTSGEGDFTLAELKPAPYKITVSAAGFKTATISDVVVAVQVTRRLDIHLEIGDITNIVTIPSDSAPVLQTESPVRQTTINERQEKELPLQVSSEFAGRTPLSFIFLDSNVVAGVDPGGDPGSRGTNVTRFSVSGGQALGTEILVDGASTRRTQNGSFFSEVAPGPNAFQEFTLSTSTYSAEFGNSSGGVVNFAIKSGANKFHGEGYDLVRNERFDANSFLNNANGLARPRDNQNDFGFNIGGPIYLPRFGEGGPTHINLKDRAFFFFNYEGYRITQGFNAVVTVPTLLMRTGDFSELLTDPYVLQTLGGPIRIYDPRVPSNIRQAIPGNRLDLVPGLIDPAGFNILQHFPLPNRPGVFHNYVSSTTAPTIMNQVTMRFDFNLSSKSRLAFSFSDRHNNRLAGGFPIFPLPFAADINGGNGPFFQIFYSQFYRLQHDWDISPKLLNHLNIGFTRYDVSNQNTTAGFVTSSLGIPANATNNIAFPRIEFPGYGDPVLSSDPRAYEFIGSTFFTDRQRDNTIAIADFVTYVTGRHTMKFGVDIRRNQFNVFQKIDPGGSFNFRADQTASDADPGGGWPIASLITGATEFSFATTNSIDPSFKQFSQSYFFNDDIKVTPHLTVNVGLRYDLPGLRYEARNRFRTFEPNVINPVVGIPGALAGAGGQSGITTPYKTLIKPDYTDIGPRLGFAYSLNNKTVVRGGVGVYYAPVLYGTGGTGDINSGTIGYNTGSGARTPNGRNSVFFLSTYPPKPPVDPNGQFIGSDVPFFNPNFKSGRTVQYSVDVQRQLPFKLAASIGYIGSKGTRLRSSFERLNALPLNDLRLGAALLNKNVNDITASDRAYATSVGVTLPASSNAVFTGFNGSVAQALRPFPQYGNVTDDLESQGKSLYNAMQLKLERRFANGIQFGASYTLSRLLTNASGDILGGDIRSGVSQNPFNLSSLYGLANTNPTHVFVVNYILELPFGHGKRFLNRGGWVDKLVGGFQLDGIQRYQSGLPLTVFTSGNTGFLNQVGYNGNLRLNFTGQPLIANGAYSPARLGFQYINPAAFAAPPLFDPGNTLGAIGSAAYAAYYSDPNRFFGNAPPVISSLRSPGYLIENVSLIKKTRIAETVTLELRAEAFNLFNRSRFFSPDLNFNDAVTFGFQSVGDPNYYPPRSIQFGARLIF